MERNPGVLASYRGQLQLLNCVSRVTRAPVGKDARCPRGGLASEAAVALLLRSREEVNRHRRGDIEAGGGRCVRLDPAAPLPRAVGGRFPGEHVGGDSVRWPGPCVAPLR